jgi:putative NADH-flavin reductase
MKLPNKIALIGGTGKSGKYLTKQLINNRIPFRILVRNPDRVPSGWRGADVVFGDVADYDTVHKLLEGCVAVISTLGLGNPPSEPTIFSKATSHVLKAMKAHKITRYILISGLNVDAKTDHKGERTSNATKWMYANFPVSTRDRQLEYKLLSDSGLDWTLVRLPMIIQTTVTKPIATSLKDCPGDQIGAKDLAIFLIGQLSSENNLREAPFLANIAD